MISYTEALDTITEEQLQGFFVGWPSRPTAQTLLRLLRSSSFRWLAIASETNHVVGYVTALSDGVLFAYISSLEVLPEYQKQGIGRELMRRMLETLQDQYAIDLVCDEDVQPFYERCGMIRLGGMGKRNYARQKGEPLQFEAP